MSLPDFSVRRPVTVIMFFLGIMLFGLISFTRLPQELYPPITYPQLSIITFYKDAAPEEMEVLITKPVEEAMGTVSGVRRISSISKEETSLVIAEFNWGTNMDFAALGAREKIDLIKESLPRGSEDPIVMKYNPFDMPLMVLNVTSGKTSSAELRQIGNKVIKNEIEKADGVAACNITGGLIPEVLIEIDQDKLMSKNIALNEVVDAISKANLNYPAGTIEESFYEYLIRTMGEFKLVGEMNDVVVGADDRDQKQREFTEFGPEDVKKKQEEAIPDKRLILLKEIGIAKDVFKDKTSISRYNKKDNVSVSIQKQADANTLWVANNVKGVLNRLKAMLPKDIKIDIVSDQSMAIRSNVRGVTDAAIGGGVLAFLVLLFFLRSFGSSAIVTVSIPISILVVYALMYLSGLTLNMISLGGLALGVGMLVDNGIVVFENIYTHCVELKKPQKQACIYGASEVSGAIWGSTLTTIAVFLPMVFVVGIAGQICKDLAFTVTFSLLASLVVAMTLIPILSTRVRFSTGIVKEEEKGLTGAFLRVLQDITHTTLVLFLQHKILSLLVVFLIFILSCSLLPKLDTELLPKVDEGQLGMVLNLPPGTKLDFTDGITKRIESYLFDMPEVKSVTVNIGSTKEKKGTALLETRGPNQAQIIVNLKPLARLGKTGEGLRYVSTSDIVQRLKDVLRPEDIAGGSLEFVLQESIFKTAFQAGAPIVVEVKGQDLNKLRQITADVQEKLRQIPGVYSIRNTLIEPAPEIKVNVFKEKAATYNLSTSDIALTAQTAIKGFIATKFKKEGEEIDIKVRLRKEDRDDMARVRRLQMHSPLGINIPLAEVAFLNLGKGPSEIKRYGQERAVIVTANIFKRSFREIADAILSALRAVKVPSGYSAELTGEREQIQESFKSLQAALILSIVLVFMIMAAQFESLWQPFVILFTIPLSIIGVILILFITHTPISIMVILGVIILGGVVVNNGIVLIDYANILRKEGMSAYDALIVASRRRLRPILMTALTTILGLIPLACALTEGSELQQPMAITVIGGLIVSTFLSLVVIPTVYLGFEEMLVFIRSFLGIAPQVAMATTGAATAMQIEIPTQQKPPQAVSCMGGEKFVAVEPSLPISPTEKQPITEEMPAKETLIKEEKKAALPELPKKEEYLLLEQPEEKPIVLPDETPKPAIILPVVPEKVEGREEGPKKKDQKTKTEQIGIAGRGDIPLELWDSLADRQQQLIRYLRENRKVTRKEYSEKFNVSIPTAARDLKFLAEKGLLAVKGPAAVGRYYTLNEGI